MPNNGYSYDMDGRRSRKVVKVDAAIQAADRIKDAGPTEAQLSALYDTAGGSADTSSSYIQSLRDAGRYR